MRRRWLGVNIFVYDQSRCYAGDKSYAIQLFSVDRYAVLTCDVARFVSVVSFLVAVFVCVCVVLDGMKIEHSQLPHRRDGEHSTSISKSINVAYLSGTINVTGEGNSPQHNRTKCTGQIGQSRDNLTREYRIKTPENS